MFETIYYHKPRGDKLFKYLADNLKTELDGYTRMAAFYEDGCFKGCAALNYTDGYCGIDIYAPAAKFTRKALRDFFEGIFVVLPLCLCVIKNNNAKSLRFVRRLGFEVVKTDAEETLLKLAKTDFERSYICATK